MPALCQDSLNPFDSLLPVAPDRADKSHKNDDEGKDEGLSEILSDRPDIPVTVPQEDAPPKASDLPLEKSVVINRRCQLENRADLGWYVLKFLAEPGKANEVTRYILPNQRLETMEAIIAKKPDTVFLVSGENALYKDRPYLIIRLALEDAAATQQAEVSAATQPQSLPAVASAPATTSVPANAQPSNAGAKIADKKPSKASADDIIRGLLEERPGKPILTAPEEAKQVEIATSVAPAVSEQLPNAWGMMVADRIIRVAQEAQSGWWVARFESDNTLQEQPIRILPTSVLRRAQLLSTTKTGKGVKLRITGEITQYKGKKYLLLRKVLVERDLGQL